jgi:hypothetical protein
MITKSLGPGILAALNLFLSASALAADSLKINELRAQALEETLLARIDQDGQSGGGVFEGHGVLRGR